MMIDWVSAIIPCLHPEPIRGGQFMMVDADGVIESQSDRYLAVEGSFSSKIAVKSLYREAGKEYINPAFAATYLTNPPSYLYFSGNPTKFLKGHNLYGSTDVIDLMRQTLEQVFDTLNLHPTDRDLSRIRSGQYPLTRIDINEMKSMESQGHALAWIRATSHASRSRHKSGGILRGDTLYFGKNSRRWAMKIYAKGQEIGVKGHEFPQGLPSRELLTNWAQNKLRWELVIRSPELKKMGLNTAAAFANANLQELFDSYKARVTIPSNEDLAQSVITHLPRQLRSIYVLWKAGEDLRQTFSKNTFYRHRRALLLHGIDISVASTQ